MTQFNPQQQLAIDALGRNVMVSASAGAGKTTVLIARLMKRILNDGVRLDEIVAMTFTEKAASEMKIRLLEALNQENRTNPTPFLQEQISLVETANITTIHSFCLMIIKNYGYVLGVSPQRATTILDDAGVSMLKTQAMDNVMHRWLEDNPHLTQRLLDIFSSNPIDEKSLRNAVSKTASWLGEKKDPESALNNVLASYAATDFNSLPLEVQDSYFVMMLNRFTLLSDAIQSLIQIIDADYESDSKISTQLPLIQEYFQYIQKTLSQINQRNISFYDDVLNNIELKLKPDGKNERYKEARNSLTSLISTIVSNHRPLPHHFDILNAQLDDISALLELTQDFLSEYNSIKIESEAFDFSDFEVYALNILKANDGAVAQQFKNQFKEIMVDEFQDTNEYQDEIVRMISNGSNIFRVGDVKQSIYRFRGAKPHIMQTLVEAQDGENLFLSFNYRSKESIVSYNNTVFSNLMNLTQGIQYSDTDHVSTGIPSQKENSLPVEFHIVERGDGFYDESINLQKARTIAQLIIEHHKQLDDSGRPLYRFKDMVVLIRSHSAKIFLKKAFEEANIPHYIDSQSGFYQSDIVTSVRAFLRYINTPNDYYLIQILSSSFIGYTDDMLARLRLYGDGSLFKLLEGFDNTNYLLIKDAIKRWRTLDLVSIITDLINFNDAYKENLDLLDKTNLDYLLEKAVGYQNQFGSSVLGFLDFMKPFEDISGNEASALSDDADVVRAFTIHQSKGLQFPLVFFWSFGKDSVIDHNSVLVHDDTLGLALDHIELPYRSRTRNLIRDVMEEKQNDEEREENLRLLYVALTRPQNKLIVVDVVKEFLNEPLSLSLLHNHQKKSQLLYAASPITTILKIIDPDSIKETRLDGIENLHKNSVFTLSFKTEDEPKEFIPNAPLDLNRYSKEGMAYGTVLHESIERLPNRMWNTDDLKPIPGRFHQALTEYNSNPFTQELYTFDEIHHEMPFTDINGEGIIDFYAIKDDEIVIVDFKSDNATTDALIDRYRDQLADYILVIKTMYPNHNVTTYLYSFYNASYIKI